MNTNRVCVKIWILIVCVFVTCPHTQVCTACEWAHVICLVHLSFFHPLIISMFSDHHLGFPFTINTPVSIHSANGKPAHTISSPPIPSFGADLPLFSSVAFCYVCGQSFWVWCLVTLLFPFYPLLYVAGLLYVLGTNKPHSIFTYFVVPPSFWSNVWVVMLRPHRSPRLSHVGP